MLARWVTLGDLDVLVIYWTIIFVGVVVYNLINFFTFKDFLRRYGFLKTARRDYYECGFRPQSQRPIKLPIQFLLICIFFLLYDIELIFLFPYVSGVLFSGAFDLGLLFFFFSLLLLSLIFDYNRHALYWQY